MDSRVEKKNAVCMWCRGWCYVQATVKDGQLLTIEGDPEYPRKVYPPVKACPRLRAASEWFYHPGRLHYPLKRAGDKGSGKWLQISWEQALDEIAGKLGEIRSKYGAEAVGTSSGTARTHDEFRGRFFHLFGSPNYFGQANICFGPRSIVAESIFGWFPNFSVRPETKCILMLGLEPSVSRKPEFNIIRNARKSGAKLIVIDPRKTHSASDADIWLQVRPGTDCALLLAMIHVILKEDLCDHDFVTRWCYGLDQLQERCREYTPEKAAEITWVPADLIRAAARTYATLHPACILESMGAEQSPQQSQILHARCILAALTGNIDRRGGEELGGPIKGWIGDREIELPEALSREQRNKQIGSDRFKLYTWQGQEILDGSIKKVWGKHANYINHQCMANAPSVYRAILTGKPYPVKAVITLSSNPMVTQANTKLVYRALKKLDLYVVKDFWMTPSAELADYVLPSASWLERPQHWSYVDYAQYLVVGERVLPPVVPGKYEHWDDFEFWRALGIRLGQEEYWPWRNLEEVYDYRLRPMGYTHREFVDNVRWLFFDHEEKKYEKTGFGTPTGKVELYSTVLEKLGYDPLPFYQEPKETLMGSPDLAQAYPFMLITGMRHDPYFHSEHRQMDSFRTRVPDPIVQIHPLTAQELGIGEGDWVWIETPRGRIRQRCQYFEGMHPKLVSAQHGWWFPELPGEEPWLRGVWESNINVVTDDDPDACNQVIGGWPLRTALCRVYKAKAYGTDVNSGRKAFSEKGGDYVEERVL